MWVKIVEKCKNCGGVGIVKDNKECPYCKEGLITRFISVVEISIIK